VIAFLSALSVTLFIFLCVSIFFNIRLGKTVLQVQDSVESSLDILDERYESISKILEIPVFFDSVEVRRVISEIKMSQNAILSVASTLSEPFGQDNVEVEKDKRVEN
jgi:hypothetical protein